MSQRRIVVALDGSAGSMSALRAAGILGRLIDAELVGVFVADEALERLARLPAVREVRPYSGEVSTLDVARLRSDLQALETIARRALRREAATMGLSSRFLVEKGRASEEILRVAIDADAIAIARVSSRPGRRGRFGSTAGGVMRGQASSLILVEPGDGLRGPMIVYYDGGPRARRALAIAIQMSEMWDHRVTVLLPPSQSAPMAARLGMGQIEIVRLRSGARDLPDVLPRGGACLLVAADSPAAEEVLLARLMGELFCSVIVVREQPGSDAGALSVDAPEPDEIE